MLLDVLLRGAHALPPKYRVAVLLSAHGSGSFLREQVASIRAAMAPDDILVVVDDGSRQVDWGALADILPANYLYWSRLQGLGSATSFMDLLLDESMRASYYCWADQDDVWQADKLHRQIQALASRPDALASVHGWRPLRKARDDAWVADSPQAPVAQRSPAHYCFETPAPGMTLCMTEEARGLLGSLDAELRFRLLLVMPHDRLACAVLGMHGRLQIIADALVDYRQHAHNQIGAPHAGLWRRNLQRLQRGLRIWRTASAGLILYRQLAADRRRTGHLLPPLQRQTLRASAWESRLLQSWVRWQGSP